MGDGWLNKLPGMFFTQNTYFPQDTTGSVATWAVVCGLFALIVVAIIKLINTIIDKATHTENPIAGQPFAPAKINGGIGAVAKTFVVAFATVALMYLVVFINGLEYTAVKCIRTGLYRVLVSGIKPFALHDGK